MSAAIATETRPAFEPREVHGSFIDETIGIVARQTRDTVSFAVGSPALEALQLVGADDLSRAVIARDGAKALGYGITEGDPELRELIAAEARDRGLDVTSDHVIVTAGALQAVDLACRVLIRPGDVAVVESPGFTNALSALRNHGARVVEVPADDEGLDVTAAMRLLSERDLRARLFFVVPNFQNPSGATMSLARRQMLVALARAHGAAVIEDDPYRLLRYRGADVPSIASLADGVNVVQAGSYSKTFVPGIRVGWAVTAPELVRRMAAAKQTTDSSTSSLGQRLVLEFARRGRFAPHLEALRQLYADKQDRARAALAREFAGTGVGWNSPEGGFYLWVRLPAALSTRRLLDAALEEGVAFVPGDAFGIAGDHADALRFSYSSPTPDRIDEGVRRLRRAFDRIRA